MTYPDSELIEIKECIESDYHPLIRFGAWRVALLNECERYYVENIRDMQRHNTSDEVFILLKGSCTLYVGDGGANGAGNISAVPMKPGKLYNIRRGVWHTHALRDGASVCVIENEDVSDENSDHIDVTLPGA